MHNRHLAFIVIGALSLMVFVFFFIRTQPIPRPQPKISSSDSEQIKTPTVTFGDPIRGAQNAKITLVEYSDFACPACKQLEPLLDRMLKTYPDDVRIVWKDFPNDSIHKQAIAASVAARCAQEQKKFWEYANALFERQSILSETIFNQIASELDLNTDKFLKCTTSDDQLPLVQKNIQEGLNLGLVASPTLFVGSTSFVGVPNENDLIREIEKQRAEQTN